jgi:hypothetical protein
MQPDALLHDRDMLKWWLQQIGVPFARFAAQRPDYLIISPPKTGSTWLADNLRRHKQIFVPSMKEIKYFSSFFKSLDLSWYLDQIAPGEGRIKGEASPSYALLPVERIRLIRWLMPEVKIIFLMRDPIARAWSHAKHNYCYREANFTDCTAPFDEVGDSQWMDNFTQDWTLAGGDYLGQLRRWLTVFPREQFYIGFYESIVSEPEKLLRDVMEFLGADPHVEFRDFPVRERILAGLPRGLSPSLRASLHRLLHDRSRELSHFLREQLNLATPVEWTDVLKPIEMPRGPSVATFEREFDDGFLAGILEQEEAFPSAWCPVIGAHQGYNLIFCRGQIYALDVHLGNVQPNNIGEAGLRRYQAEHQCFVAPSLSQVKAQIDQHVFEKVQSKLAELPPLHTQLSGDLIDARDRLAQLERVVREHTFQLRQIEVDHRLLRPWFWFAGRFLRPMWRVAKKNGIKALTRLSGLIFEKRRGQAKIATRKRQRDGLHPHQLPRSEHASSVT